MDRQHNLAWCFAGLLGLLVAAGACGSSVNVPFDDGDAGEGGNASSGIGGTTSSGTGGTTSSGTGGSTSSGTGGTTSSGTGGTTSSGTGGTTSSGTGGTTSSGTGGTTSSGTGGTTSSGTGGSNPCSPLTQCGSECVDTSSDEQHCGYCFNACLVEQSCWGYACHCPPGLSECGGACVDTNTDEQHCGGCYHPCDASEQCVQGGCIGCSDDICGVCDVTPLGSAVPQTVLSTNVGAGNSLISWCTPPDGLDVSFTFTAPSTGTYIFDTIGSNFDTVLHIRDAQSCQQLACDDDGAQSLQSRITLPLSAGEEVLVTVDGFSGGSVGSIVLNLTEESQPPPPPCPIMVLSSSYPLTVSGSTATAANNYQGTCGGAGAPEISYSFTAPVAGMYTFHTIGSSYDTLLHLRNGGCDGPQLSCDDDGGQNLTSLISINLAAGQMVVIFVDGFGSSSGPYQLHILGP